MTSKNLATTNRERVEKLLLAMMDSSVFHKYDPPAPNSAEQNFVDAGLLDYIWQEFPHETGLVGEFHSTYTVTDSGKKLVDSIVDVDTFMVVAGYFLGSKKKRTEFANANVSLDNIVKQIDLMMKVGVLNTVTWQPTPFGCTVFNAMVGQWIITRNKTMTTVDNRKAALKYLLFLATSDSFGVANGMPIQKQLGSFVDSGILAATVDDIGTSYTITGLGRIVAGSITDVNIFHSIGKMFGNQDIKDCHIPMADILHEVGDYYGTREQVREMLKADILLYCEGSFGEEIYKPTPFGYTIFSALA